MLPSSTTVFAYLIHSIRESLLMSTLVTRAASCIIDPDRELICSPIVTPLGLCLQSAIYHYSHKQLMHSLSLNIDSNRPYTGKKSREKERGQAA